MKLSTRRVGLGLIVLTLVAVVIFASAQFLSPGAATLSLRFSGAQILFSADRRMVFAANDCVTLRWEVENIREIYVDDTSTLGEGTARSCPTPERLPSVRLVFADGSTAEFELPIQFFIEQPLALLLLIAMVGLLIAAGTVMLMQRAPTAQTLAAAAASTQPPSPRLGRPLHWIGLLSVVIIGILLGAELILRAVFSIFGTPQQQISYLQTAESIAAAPRLMSAVPFLGYTMSPDYAGHNQLGFRGPEVQIPKPAGLLRVVAMGSSTTYGLTAADQTYPVWLERTLRQHYRVTDLEVINAGVYGYTSWQTFINFSLRILELQPDLVIIYHVETDISPRQADPNCYRGNHALLGLDPRGYIFSDVNPGTVGSSALYRFLAVNLGNQPDAAAYVKDIPFTKVRVKCEIGNLTDAENLAKNPPIYFERNFRNLIAVAKMNQIPLLLSTWAYWEDSPEPEPYWRAAIAEHNDILRRLATTHDVPLIDYATLAPQTDDKWADFIHMNAEGSRLQGEAFAAFIVQNHLLDPQAKAD